MLPHAPNYRRDRNAKMSRDLIDGQILAMQEACKLWNAYRHLASPVPMKALNASAFQMVIDSCWRHPVAARKFNSGQSVLIATND